MQTTFTGVGTPKYPSNTKQPIEGATSYSLDADPYASGVLSYLGQYNMPPSTSTAPLSYFPTSQNFHNVPSLLNNYEENSYGKTQVPPMNIIPNRYSNSELHSEGIYSQYEYKPSTTEEYNHCNHVGSETTPSTEGFYDHEPNYLQDVNCQSQINYSFDESICSRNEQISANNDSLISEGGDNNEAGTKRTRQIYTKEQTETLEDEFKNNTYINKARRAELSKHLSLSEKKIKIWFQNRRTKNKKQQTFQQS
ncbi:hypothetical protein M0804_001036 [Polistes exclamans]|nr:hypothetical protein M0804_001036 [Polistes exclamans]